MTIRRILVSILDRPGGRAILSKIATAYYRHLVSDDKVSIFWDGSWFTYSNNEFISENLKFDFYKPHLIGRNKILSDRRHAAKDYWFYKYTPKEGDVILDVGAGSGHETGVFSQAVGKTGKVICVEAHPVTFERLSKTCSYNNYANVTLKNCAITSKDSLVYIDDKQNDEMNSILDNKSTTSFEISGVTIDNLCKSLDIDHITFLKMNIEGAEQFAILGMKEMIHKIDYIAIACHDFIAEDENDYRYLTREKVKDFLSKNGFSFVVREDDPRPYVKDHIHAWRNDLSL